MTENCGPFSEPGQYQCVLSSALYFIMFHPRLFEAKERIYNRVLPCLDYNSFYKRLYRNSNIGFLLPIAFLKNNRQTNEIRYYIITIIGTMLFMSMTKLGNEFMNTVVFHKIYANGQLISLNSGGARTISISSVLTYHIQPPYHLDWSWL